MRDVSVLLTTKRVGKGAFVYEEELPSTNRRAREVAMQGAPDGSVVLCFHQTAGRGRLARDWDSTPGKDLTFSVLLRIHQMEIAPLYSFCTALAVARVLVGMGFSAKVKWPNDVLLDGKKVCGILCELCGDAVILGVGLNVNRSSFPEEIRDRACSLKTVSGKEWPLDEVLVSLLGEMETAIELLEKEGVEALLYEYRKFCVTLGAQVNVIGTSGSFAGFAEDLTPDGRLIVLSGNEKVTVSAGDVSVRGMYGYAES